MTKPKSPSRTLIEGPARAPARAMLRAAGYDDEAMAKPMIAILNTWSSVTPCNMHLADLAVHPPRGHQGGRPARRSISTPSWSRTVFSMGTEGMRASLMSRECVRRFRRTGRARTLP